MLQLNGLDYLHVTLAANAGYGFDNIPSRKCHSAVQMTPMRARSKSILNLVKSIIVCYDLYSRSYCLVVLIMIATPVSIPMLTIQILEAMLKPPDAYSSRLGFSKKSNQSLLCVGSNPIDWHL